MAVSRHPGYDRLEAAQNQTKLDGGLLLATEAPAVKANVTVHDPRNEEIPDSLRSAFAYWDGLRRQRPAPLKDDFQLLELDPKTIPFTIIVDVLNDPLDFRYRFWGSGNTTFIGYDCTGQSVRENPIFHEKVFKECKRICNECAALVFHTNVLKPDGLHREYWRMRLPLIDRDENVIQIVSIVHILERPNEPLSEIF